MVKITESFNKKTGGGTVQLRNIRNSDNLKVPIPKGLRPSEEAQLRSIIKGTTKSLEGRRGLTTDRLIKKLNKVSSQYLRGVDTRLRFEAFKDARRIESSIRTNIAKAQQRAQTPLNAPKTITPTIKTETVNVLQTGGGTKSLGRKVANRLIKTNKPKDKRNRVIIQQLIDRDLVELQFKEGKKLPKVTSGLLSPSVKPEVKVLLPAKDFIEGALLIKGIKVGSKATKSIIEQISKKVGKSNAPKTILNLLNPTIDTLKTTRTDVINTGKEFGTLIRRQLRSGKGKTSILKVVDVPFSKSVRISFGKKGFPKVNIAKKELINGVVKATAKPTKKGTKSEFLLTGIKTAFDKKGKIISSNPILESGEIISNKALKNFFGQTTTAYKKKLRSFFVRGTNKNLLQKYNINKKLTPKQANQLLNDFDKSFRKDNVFKALRSELKLNPKAVGLKNINLFDKVKGKTTPSLLKSTIVEIVPKKVVRAELRKLGAEIKTRFIQKVSRSGRKLGDKLLTSTRKKVNFDTLPLKDLKGYYKAITISTNKINALSRNLDLKDVYVISNTKGRLKAVPKKLIPKKELKKAISKTEKIITKKQAKKAVSETLTKAKTAKKAITSKQSERVAEAIINAFGVAGNAVAQEIQTTIFNRVGRLMNQASLTPSQLRNVRGLVTTTTVQSIPRTRSVSSLSNKVVNKVQQRLRRLQKSPQVPRLIRKQRIKARQTTKQKVKKTPRRRTRTNTTPKQVKNLIRVPKTVQTPKLTQRIKIEPKITPKPRTTTTTKTRQSTLRIINPILVIPPRAGTRGGLPPIPPKKKKRIKKKKKKSKLRRGKTTKRPTNRLLDQLRLKNKAPLFKAKKRRGARNGKKKKKKKNNKKKTLKNKKKVKR